jgi:hypothetical protein
VYKYLYAFWAAKRIMKIKEIFLSLVPLILANLAPPPYKQ